MKEAPKLIEELEELISQERYADALVRFEDEGSGLIESLPRSSDQRKLLLLAAEINIKNHLSHEAGVWLNRLKEEYPEVESAFDYVISKTKKYLLEGEYDNCLTHLESCLGKGLSEGENCWLRYYIGMTFFWKGDYFKSTRLFEECQDYAISSGDDYLAGSASYMLGYIAFQRCFFQIAEANYNRALVSFVKCGKNAQLGKTYKMIGILAYRTGEYDKSEGFLRQAMNCYELCGNRIDVIDSKIALGRVNIFKGQYAEAEALLLGSRREASKYGYRREIALSAEFLGELCYHQGRYDESLNYLKSAEGIALEIAPEGDVAVEVFRRLGDVYLALGRVEEAEEALSKAHKLCEPLNDKYELGSVLRAYGMVAARKNDIVLAESFFNEAVVTLKLIKESFELGRTLLLSAEVYADWATGRESAGQQGTELLQKARDNAVEAMHLFSSIKLQDRAETCKELVHRLESNIDHGEVECRHETIRFNDKWLHEGCVVAASRSMNQVLSRVRDLAPGMVPVLVTGETGTGKEIVARLLHRLSGRAEGPFVPVNCASIPDTVFESEFFGHKRGSFTGAIHDEKGLIENASGGTLFLDEISELSSRHQAKLLRALQEKSVRRLGETTERPVDVRLVSASNERVEYLIESGRLRKDFYYRISAGVIELEPLRERKDDILPLFSYYLDDKDGGFSVEEGIHELLLGYHWPGNVRELVNVTEVLALLGQRSRVVRKRDLPLAVRDYIKSEPGRVAGTSPSVRALQGSAVQGYGPESSESLCLQIEDSLRRHGGNKSAVARDLGIGRSTLYRRMEELDIV